MAATTPIIQTDGASAGLGTAGVGREDFAIGESIDVTDDVAGNAPFSHSFSFADVPIGSALAALTNPDTAVASFITDVTGSYRIICRVDGIFTGEITVSVNTPNLGIRIPVFDERIGTYNKDGNLKSYHKTITNFIRAVDAFAGGAAALDVAQKFLKQQYSDVEILTDAATVLINAPDSNLFSLLATGAIGGTRQLDNPTALATGMQWQVWYRQSSGGNNGLTFDSFYDFGDEGAPDFSAAPADQLNVITCQAVSTTQIIATILPGFS